MAQSNSPKKPKSVKIILNGLFILCGFIFLLDFLFLSEKFDKHAIYEWENWPGFYAVFGFVACVLLVLISKYILRPLVKRDEDYYE
ncbi:MAG: hypothetical protein JKY51_04125 [Opitutaceae bacterium]|nr:hypothetical protein [Opitutaceae bacterium]